MEQHESEAALAIVGLMAVSARTAPKARGLDTIKTAVVHGEGLPCLADVMDILASERNLPFFARDATNIRASAACLLVGVDSSPLNLDCGACGYCRCADLPEAGGDAGYAGPLCHFKTLDLGIALGSAAKTASMHNADNRVMYTAGVAARRLGLLDADMVVAIPVSVTGKNIFFDRG